MLDKIIKYLPKGTILTSFITSEQGNKLLTSYLAPKRVTQITEDGAEYRLINMLIVGAYLLDNNILHMSAPQFLAWVLSTTSDGLCDYSAWQAFESKYYSFYFVWEVL